MNHTIDSALALYMQLRSSSDWVSDTDLAAAIASSDIAGREGPLLRWALHHPDARLKPTLTVNPSQQQRTLFDLAEEVWPLLAALSLADDQRHYQAAAELARSEPKVAAVAAAAEARYLAQTAPVVERRNDWALTAHLWLTSRGVRCVLREQKPPRPSLAVTQCVITHPATIAQPGVDELDVACVMLVTGTFTTRPKGLRFPGLEACHGEAAVSRLAALADNLPDHSPDRLFGPWAGARPDGPRWSEVRADVEMLLSDPAAWVGNGPNRDTRRRRALQLPLQLPAENLIEALAAPYSGGTGSGFPSLGTPAEKVGWLWANAADCPLEELAAALERCPMETRILAIRHSSAQQPMFAALKAASTS